MTSILRDAAQAALDALCLPCDRWNGAQARIVNAAIDGLRTALAAQPAPDAPVLFWYRPRFDGLYEGPLHTAIISQDRRESEGWVPLFPGSTPIAQQAAPAQARQPLTDERIAEIVLSTVYEGDASTPHRDAWAAEIGIPFARAIEAAHGISAPVAPTAGEG